MNNHVTVIGKRWFERVNGNTYHSCHVYVNGKHIGGVDFTYGYGSHYTQTALEILQQAGYYTGVPHSTTLWQAIHDAGDTLVDSVTDVNRKKDL